MPVFLYICRKISTSSDMVYISLPEGASANNPTKNKKPRELPFYLAMEEYVARHSGEDAFFMWQVEPTVIFGRNQHLESEVNVDYCRRHHIKMVRRKSGGGCVYADKDNVMLSMISCDEKVDFAFNRFVNAILLVLHKMGIEATGTHHNDILIDNKKVSGTACYHLPGHSIVHSTLLYDTNMEHMLHAITPSTEKLQSKGIQSVRQRITLLKDYTQLTIDEVKALIRDTLCSGERILTVDDVHAIEKIEKDYLKEEFIHLI